MVRTAPLKKDKVTQGSQVILPAYPVLFLMVAGAFLFQSDSRTQGDAFNIARMVTSIQTWGIIFAVVGAFEVFSMMLHKRISMIWALVVGAGLSGFWASLIFTAAVRSDSVSWTSGMYISFVVVAHIASVRSLARDSVL